MQIAVNCEGACLISQDLDVCSTCIPVVCCYEVKAATSSTGLLVEAVCAVCSLRSFKLQESLKRPTSAKVSPAMPIKLCQL